MGLSSQMYKERPSIFAIKSISKISFALLNKISVTYKAFPILQLRWPLQKSTARPGSSFARLNKEGLERELIPTLAGCDVPVLGPALPLC